MAHVAISMVFESGKKADDRLIPIDDTEGEKLAGAVQKVLRHYDLPDIASETKDWIGLIMVAGAIYGPRVAASWAQANTAKAERAAEQAPREMTVAQ